MRISRAFSKAFYFIDKAIILIFNYALYYTIQPHKLFLDTAKESYKSLLGLKEDHLLPFLPLSATLFAIVAPFIFFVEFLQASLEWKIVCFIIFFYLTIFLWGYSSGYWLAYWRMVTDKYFHEKNGDLKKDLGYVKMDMEKLNKLIGTP